jgi:hypothetical protein
LADRKVLTETAFQRTTGQENRAGTFVTGEGRFLATMDIGRSYFRPQPRPADATLALDTVDTATMWAEIAGGQTAIGLANTLKQFAGLIKSEVVHTVYNLG